MVRSRVLTRSRSPVLLASQSCRTSGSVDVSSELFCIAKMNTTDKESLRRTGRKRGSLNCTRVYGRKILLASVPINKFIFSICTFIVQVVHSVYNSNIIWIGTLPLNWSIIWASIHVTWTWLTRPINLDQYIVTWFYVCLQNLYLIFNIDWFIHLPTSCHDAN